MDKFWDKKIKYPIYFCNEIKNIKKYNQIKTGNGTFVQNLKTILNKIETKYIFYFSLSIFDDLLSKFLFI